MGYLYNGKDLYNFQNDLIKALDQLEGQSKDIKEAASKAFLDDGWKGQAADKYQAYYGRVYLNIIKELSDLNSRIRNCLKLYCASYIGNVDTDHNAVIPGLEVDAFYEALEGRTKAAADVQSAVSTQISNVRDITGRINFENPYIVETIAAIKNEINGMYERINATEASAEENLSGFYLGYEALLELIEAALATKVSSDGRSIELNETGIENALRKMQIAQAEQEAWEAQTAEAVSVADAYLEADAVARREEEMATLRTLVGIGCAVLAIAATVATGGAFAAVVIAGAASGAVVAGVNSAADQYVATGNTNLLEYDWAEIGKDAAIGGVVGGVTSAVSFGITSGVTTAAAHTTIVQAGMNSSSTVTQMLTFGAVGSGSSVLSGAGSRMAGTITSQLLENQSVDWNTVFSSGFSLSDMGKDAAVGFGTGMFQGYRHANEKMSPDVPDEYAKKDENGNPIKNKYGQNEADWATKPDGSASEGYELDSLGEDKKYPTTIKEGTKLQRYGPDYGSYLSNEGASVDDCALPYKKSDLYKHEYVFVKDAPAEYGKVGSQPAFGSQGKGGATQYRVYDGGSGYDSINNLMEKGIIVEVPVNHYSDAIHGTQVVNQENRK